MSRETPAQTLRRLGLRPVKGLGQHFLVDARVVERIVEALGVAPGDAVLEIGPGLGALTGPLLAAGARVTAVERDRNMAEALGELFPVGEDLRVVRGDILRTDLSPLLSDARPAVAGNLPYNISAPVVFHLLRYADRTGPWVLMFQKEVARRLRARPGDRECGAITALVAPFRQVSTVTTVGRGAFHPPPAVDSEVVRFDPRERSLLGEVDPGAYRRVVKAAFGTRRKTLKNALKSGGFADPAGLLARAEVDAGRRGETLTVAEFVRVAAAL